MSDIWRLVVCRIDIVDTGFEAGIHNVQILIGKSYIDDHVRTVGFQQFNKLRNVVRVNLSRLNIALFNALDLLGDLVAAGEGPAGKTDFSEGFGNLRAFVRDYLADAARADDEDFFRHFLSPD